MAAVVVVVVVVVAAAAAATADSAPSPCDPGGSRWHRRPTAFGRWEGRRAADSGGGPCCDLLRRRRARHRRRRAGPSAERRRDAAAAGGPLVTLHGSASDSAVPTRVVMLMLWLERAAKQSPRPACSSS